MAKVRPVDRLIGHRPAAASRILARSSGPQSVRPPDPGPTVVRRRLASKTEPAGGLAAQAWLSSSIRVKIHLNSLLFAPSGRPIYWAEPMELGAPPGARRTSSWPGLLGSI